MRYYNINMYVNYVELYGFYYSPITTVTGSEHVYSALLYHDACIYVALLTLCNIFMGWHSIADRVRM